jgi:hypothetical protein
MKMMKKRPSPFHQFLLLVFGKSPRDIAVLFLARIDSRL